MFVIAEKLLKVNYRVGKKKYVVIPAKAGIQKFDFIIDSRFRGNDKKERGNDRKGEQKTKSL